MTAFNVTIGIGDATGQRFEPVEALVDTGSTYTWVPTSTLTALGLTPSEERIFELADSRQIHYGVCWTSVELNGLVQPTLVVFGADNTQPLLGVFTLEGFRLGVDPVNHRLIPVPALLKHAAVTP